MGSADGSPSLSARLGWAAPPELEVLSPALFGLAPFGLPLFGLPPFGLAPFGLA